MNGDYAAAAAAVPPGYLSDAACEALRRLAACGDAAAAALLEREHAARLRWRGPPPRRNPFAAACVLDAYRRHRQNSWPRHCPPAQPIYRVITRGEFRLALRRLQGRHEGAFVTLGHLRAHRGDAPGAHHFVHRDPEALARAAQALADELWTIWRNP